MFGYAAGNLDLQEAARDVDSPLQGALFELVRFTDVQGNCPGRLQGDGCLCWQHLGDVGASGVQQVAKGRHGS
jgi:hypothetical protein